MIGFPIIRKGFAVVIMLLFVVAGSVPSTAQLIVVTSDTVRDFLDHFGLMSNVVVSWDANVTKEPIIPRGEIRVVALNIMFSVMWGFGGRLINRLLRYHPVIIKVKVVDTPEWSVATLSQGTLQGVIPEREGISYQVGTQLAVQVDDVAPAFQVFPVTIETTVEPLLGPLGLFPLLRGTTQVVHVTFIVGYKPLIQPHYPQGIVIETPPSVPVNHPIGITNLGNGRTIVANEVVSLPVGWTVALPAELVLEVDEYKEMNLSILASSDFLGQETITVSFTPHSYENYSLVGQTIYTTFLAYYIPS